jgi:adenosylcobyric acid synthase
MAPEILLDAEDGVSLEEARHDIQSSIAVVRLPHISNFTDFRLLPCQWISRPLARQMQWIILPGTKNTIGDLAWLRQQGLADWIVQQRRDGAKILGICGGYQMLGGRVHDPDGVESRETKACDGLGLLPVNTVLEATKITRVVAARTPAGRQFGAYEIHMGRTEVHGGQPFAFLEGGGVDGTRVEGVLGTYLHGALENPGVLRELFGLEVEALPAFAHYDRLAEWFRAAVNLALFEEIYL